jgi:hypothetical protein
MKTPLERNIKHEFDETTLSRQPKRINSDLLSPIIFSKRAAIKI